MLESKHVRLEVSRDQAEFKFLVIFRKNRPCDPDFGHIRFKNSKNVTPAGQAGDDGNRKILFVTPFFMSKTTSLRGCEQDSATFLQNDAPYFPLFDQLFLYQGSKIGIFRRL